MTDDLHYTVRRFNWRWAGSCFVRLPGETRLARHATREAAIADRDEREGEVRSRINPFECGMSFHDLTTFPEPVFCDWLLDEAIEPPKPIGGVIPWAAWWDRAKIGGKPTPFRIAKLRPQKLTPEQELRVWNGLNRVRFHEVIERRPSQLAYAVVSVLWEYDDNWMDPGEEGGRLHRVYRRREDAEAECELREVAARRENTSEPYRFVMDRWTRPTFGEKAKPLEYQYDLCSGAEARFYEVIEIDLGDQGGS